MPRIPQNEDSPGLTSKTPQVEAEIRVFLGFDHIEGVDSSAAREDIDDSKAYYLENIMPLGGAKLAVVPNISAPLYNFAENCYAQKSVNISNSEKIVAFGNSGKVYLYDVASNTSIVLNQTGPFLSGVGSWCDQWQNSDILFIDSTGYYDWNATTGWKKIAGTGAPTAGDNICVFNGRVWITNGRSLYVSGAAGFDDGSINTAGTNFWLPSNGAAFSGLIDPAIRSNISRMFQANGLLYLYHSTGVNVISNVQVPLGSVPPTPVWQNQNIQSAIGTDQPYSVVGYSTFNLFASKQGAYMMYGLAAPQLSSEMIGTWRYLDFTKPIWAGQCVIFQQLCAAFLLNRKGDPNLPDATILAIWFKRDNKDRWFFCNFGALTSIVTSWINGVPTLFGMIGTQLYRLFVTGTTPPAVVIKSKLWHLEDPTARKELLRAGCFLDVTIPGSSFTMTVDDENGSADTIAAIPGPASGVGTFLFNGSCPPNNGRCVGFTINATGYDFVLHWIAFDYKLRQRWGTPWV